MLVPFDRLVISTIDPESGLLSDAHISGQRLDEGNLTGAPYSLEDSALPASVYEKHEPVVADATSLSSISRAYGAANNSVRIAAGLQSAMFVPIVLQGNLVGSLVFRSIQKNSYGNHEVRLGTQIAAQIAGVIATSQQFVLLERESAIRQKLADEQARIAEIGRIVSSSLELDEVLSAFVEQAQSLVPFDRLVVALVNQKITEITDVLVSGILVEEDNHPKTLPVRGDWLMHGPLTDHKTLIANGADYVNYAKSRPQELIRQQAGVNSLVITPLQWQGHVVGTLNLRSKTPNAYGPHQVDLIEQIGDQIAGAIATSNHYNQLEAALRDVQLQATALEAAEDAIIIRNADTTVAYVNAAFEKQTGFSKEEVFAPDFKYPEQAILTSDEIDEHWKQLRQGNTWRRTLPSTHKDGSKYIVDATLSPIFNETGEVDKFLGVRRDVTERVKAEEANKTLATAIEAAYDAVIIINTDTSIEWVNQAFVRDTGYSKEEAFGHPSPFLGSSKNTSGISVAAWEQVGSGQPWIGRLWTKRKDGSEYLSETSLTPVFGDDGTVTKYISTKRDITNLVQAELDREARRDLDAQNKQLLELNEQREEFFSIVSHELRTPLTAIMAFADILGRDRDGALANIQKEHIDVIKRNSKNLNGLIEDMLDFSRMSTDQLKLEKSEFEIHSLLDLVVESLEPTARQRNQTLTIEPHTKPVWVSADHGRIVQVVSNLITNSCKYSPPETRITVRVGSNASRVSIAVSDEGIGIPEEDLTSIFLPFFRSNQLNVRNETGTGLGLAIAKTLVDLHHGKIEANSKIDKGTDITMTLPVASSTPTRNAQSQSLGH
ncbi:MAG: PAS domain S-box protein [Chloroflexi bacterium]|nr:PAS domain S-box protein [Chloroflexota bacterium]